MYHLGGRQLCLVLAPSTKGPNSTPRIVRFGVGESKEEADDGRTSPHRNPGAYKPPGKATKRPSPPANPGTTAEGEVGAGSPSKASRKKATQPRPPHPQKTMKCPLCGRVCPGLKVLNKHKKEVHMGTWFKCEYCSQKFKTPANKKNYEYTVCPSDRSPAGAKRRAHPRTPEPEEGEGSEEEMSVSSDREYPDTGSTGKTDQGARRHHAPQAPSPIPEREFRRALLLEPLENWEYAIPLGEPNGQEIKGVEDREMV